MKLYEITNEFNEVLHFINSSLENEVADNSLIEDLSSMLDSLQLEKTQKILNIGRYIKNLSAEVEAHKAEAKKQQAKAKVLENRIDALKNYLALNMDRSEKYNDPTVEVSYSSRGSVKIDIPLSELNDWYVDEQTVLKANKKAIKQALENGETISGAHLEYNLIVK
jgi:hypothetical protein